MEGFVVKNAYGNDELKVNDTKGGFVSVILNDESIRYFSGEVGLVISYTHNNVGGTEVIRTSKDIIENIEGINRIKRIDDSQKALLIEFLKTFKQYVKD